MRDKIARFCCHREVGKAQLSDESSLDPAATLSVHWLTRLLVSLTNMHVFWQPGFTLLHARVCDFLAEPHHVGLLPLLAVNQHLRKLATKRLVEAYSKAVCKGWSEDGVTLKIVGGGFVRVRLFPDVAAGELYAHGLTVGPSRSSLITG